MHKKILKILSKNNESLTPAIWLMRQAGRYLPEYQQIRKNSKNFLDLCYNSDLACEVTLQPIRRFNLDAAIIFSDILVIPDAMGIKVRFEENHGPILESIQTIEQIKEISIRKNKEKLLPIYEAIEKTKANLPKNVALIGFSGGAWTLASYIVEGKLSRDLSKVKSVYYNDKAFFKLLLDELIDSIAEHLINQVKAGAEVLQIFDSWAGLLAGDDYNQLIIKPTQDIIKKVRSVYPNIPIICFPRMSSLRYKKFCLEVNCQGVSVDQYISLDYIKENSNGKVIQGNLDPILLFSKSTDLIKQRVDNILEAMNGENFIFNLGHGVLPKTPIENVEFLINYIKKKG